MWRTCVRILIVPELDGGLRRSCRGAPRWRTIIRPRRPGKNTSRGWAAVKTAMPILPTAGSWATSIRRAAATSTPPPVPPERYWKPYYQTPEGRKRVEAWYEGYHYGAIASEQDSAPELARIPTAPGLGAPPPQFLLPPPPTAVPAEEVLPNPDAYSSLGHPTAQPLVADAPAARTLSPPPPYAARAATVRGTCRRAVCR